MKLAADKLKRVVELISEVEEIMKCQTTFLQGDDPEDIRGILLADAETTDDVLGPVADSESMN